jgi:hypothetical protein
MATLAPKLPYTHPFAGGFPYRGSQRLPSDPDALTYLAAVAAADGAPVEVGVATAVDDFFKGTKADGTFSAIKAACLLCGARTLAGALVPLVGAAPTNVADGFVAGDYTRGGATPGLKGDGTSYLDSGVANNSDFGGTVADPQNDCHHSAYLTEPTAFGVTEVPIGTAHAAGLRPAITLGINSVDEVFVRCNTEDALEIAGEGRSTGFFGVSRNSSAAFGARVNGADYTLSSASIAPSTLNSFVFARNSGGSPINIASARLAFYSIGESISDLAAFDARVPPSSPPSEPPSNARRHRTTTAA